MNRLSPVLALVMLAACAADSHTRPATTPAPAPTVSQAAHELRISAALEPLVLACRSAESARPNALDDDCDGGIDDLGREAALGVAWASAGGAELEVALVDAGGKAITPQRERHAAACPADGAAAASSRVYDALPDAPGRLVLRQLRPCGEKGPVTVLVAIGTRAGSHSYLVAVPADAPVTLAELSH